MFRHLVPIKLSPTESNRCMSDSISIHKIFLIGVIALSSISPMNSTAQHAGELDAASGDGTGYLGGKKVLIVFLSRTGNTKAIAQIIQKQVGGRLVQLELVTPYPQNYQEQVAQVVRENNSGFLPPLKTDIDSIAQFDVVFVGFPTWDMKMPPPMKSFLKKYDFSGKTIIPFNTNAGYGIGTSSETIKELCENSKVLEGFTMTGGIERDGVYFVIKDEKAKAAEISVEKWLQRIKVLKGMNSL